MIALLWILIALIVLDIIAHLQHITLLSELKNGIALLKSKIEKQP